MDCEKYLIVNADDFGQSPGINRGIIEAHERGIVTSTSLMTRWGAAADAAMYAREHPKLSVGLHLDFGEWVYREGNWLPLYTVVPVNDAEAVEQEICSQLDAFYRLLGKYPTHINSHQHVHMREPVRSLALQCCERLGIPLRNLCSDLHYFTKFYGQTTEGLPLPTHISLDCLIEILSRLLPSGWTVLTCHPGYVDDVPTMYRLEREEELTVLCHPRIRSLIDALSIKLCTFDDWQCFRSSLDEA